MKTLFVLQSIGCIACFVAVGAAYAQLPAEAMRRIPTHQAVRVSIAPTVDGSLADSVWSTAAPLSEFRQVEPNEGALSAFRTTVRLLFDAEHLYIGVDCRDSLGVGGIRVQDLRRKFVYNQNDLFAMSIDALHDQRDVAAFQIPPYGAQRELQVFDDLVQNREWEAVWRVRTQVTDSGWTAEVAIPWIILHYLADGSR